MNYFIVYIFLTITIGYHQVCFSQPKQEKIIELTKLMKQDSLMEKVIKSTLGPLLSQQNNLKTRLAMEKKINEMLPLINEMNEKLLENDLVKIYMNYFTETDIDELIKFYSSPIGRKLHSVSPTITKELITIVNQKYLPIILKTVSQN
ncbi:DUF2059 domain-containing protein [Pedobacter puniceum]|nr:DUF2059 domain-containing protein [Pedobacter puniceum]